MAALPARLSDLRRTDSAVRLRCASCGREHVLDREALIRRLGRAADAPIDEAATWCDARACEGIAVFAAAEPCSDDPVTARRRAAELAIVNLACEVLKAAAYAPAVKLDQQPPVRLALRVAHAFGTEADLCARFWAKVTAATVEPWDGSHAEYGWIALALVRAGHNVSTELRPD